MSVFSEPSLTESTFQKLANSIQQYATSALSSTQLPTFSGEPDEDVHNFLRRFKLATITLSDELRCLALQKSLAGAAHTWARDSIKSELAQGHWKSAKRQLVERFSLPNRELRYQEKITKMKFDPSKATLQSYVEDFADCYKKAHGNVPEQTIIKALSFNLPKSIIKHLHSISDSWLDLETLSRFSTLVKHIETKILPFETQETSESQKVTMAAITQVLKELQEAKAEARKSREESAKKAEEAAQGTEAVAAVHFEGPSHPRNLSYGPNHPQFAGYQQARFGGHQPDQAFDYTH